MIDGTEPAAQHSDVRVAIDYILTVLVPDIKHYEQFLHTTLFEQAGVTHVRSAIVLREITSEASLPIDVAPGAKATRLRT